MINYYTLNNSAIVSLRPPTFHLKKPFDQSAGAVKYADTVSAEGSLPHNECPGYDTKQSDGEVSVMMELCGMRGIPLLPSLPRPLWPGVVAPDMGPIYGLNRTKPYFFRYTDTCI